MENDGRERIFTWVRIAKALGINRQTLKTKLLQPDNPLRDLVRFDDGLGRHFVFRDELDDYMRSRKSLSE